MRTFVAIHLPDHIRAELKERLSLLKRELPEDAIRWTRLEGIHLTLKFLGDVAPGKVDAVGAVLEAEVPLHKRFSLRVGGVGCFPNPLRPRVLWVGVEETTGELASLQSRLETQFADLGFPEERRGFSPHLTLGRVKRWVQGAELRQIGRSVEVSDVPPIGEFEALEVCLFKSDLRPTGAVYTALHVVPLAGET